MAKVPDLGSDFAQKLLKDLRRRRERLGFESAPPPAQRGTANAAAPRGKFRLLAGAFSAVGMFALHWHCVPPSLLSPFLKTKRGWHCAFAFGIPILEAGIPFLDAFVCYSEHHVQMIVRSSSGLFSICHVLQKPIRILENHFKFRSHIKQLQLPGSEDQKQQQINH